MKNELAGFTFRPLCSLDFTQQDFTFTASPLSLSLSAWIT